MGPISRLQRLQGPFALALSDAAFDAGALQQLQGLFRRPQPWVRHQDHFYRCFIAEVDGQLETAFLEGLRDQVARVLELELAGPVRVTAQRMEAGDGSDRHTDRPLVGYEAARLVVQLDAVDGGHFRAFDGDRVWVDRPPAPNQAVAFELCPQSEHDVTPCAHTRRTVVFHFWHAANPIDAREALDRELSGLSFAGLPDALDPVMAQAEANHPEERTYRAAAVAFLLQRWGASDRSVVGGYLGVIEDRSPQPLEAMARWLVRLHLDDFDRAAWQALAESLKGEELGALGARWLARAG